jgi:betaine reductase
VSELRVVHYLNQFFGRVGGEEAGDFAFTVRDGPLGPGTKLEQELAGAGRVVATIICGDNRAATDLAAFGAEVETALRELHPDVVVAGPAFNAGRYGLACGEVCARASALGIPGVTAMHTENPGVEIHRRRAYILPAAPTALGMNDALQRLARFAVRLGRREEIGPPRGEGYFGRGVRKVELLDRRAADRALDMLAARLAGKPFTTEMPLPAVERIAPAPPVAELAGARVAIVTTGGIVPKGNPDGLKQSNATEWRAYSIEGLASLEPGTFESIHAGYDTSFANADPNYVVPLDALRELEREGAVASVHPRYYMTVGVGTAVAEARRMGREIAQDLRSQDVDAVILTAT